MAFTSYCRATTDTDAPATNDDATISRFSASGQDLCRRPTRKLMSILDFVDTSNSTAVIQAMRIRQIPQSRQAAHTAGIRMTRNRGIGWDHLHVAIDDASRLAYTELLADDRKGSATGFLARALAWFARHGVTVERVMTDNSSAYRSRDFASAIAAAGLRHLRTRPYTPRTNGKAERFIQSSLRDWAYAHPFDSSAARGFAMQSWINTYNHTRPHAALAGKPPITRIASDNLLGNDT